MASQEDVRRIALALPGVIEADCEFAFSVPHGGRRNNFAWAWNERVEPRKPRVPRADVLALRVPEGLDKEALLAAEPQKFFTEPHYDGFAAVLVRLGEVELAELEELILDAWRCRASRALIEAHEAERS